MQALVQLLMDENYDSEWISLYRKGWSTTRIGKKYGVGPSTVGYRLHKYISLRDRIEAAVLASTKYLKKPFSGDSLEGAYLSGFVEDCHVRKAGRQLEVATTTTHPALEELFRNSFGSYSHVTRFAGFDNLHFYYRYHLTTYLDTSFEVILAKSEDLPAHIPRELGSPLLNEYLGGLLDAEGTVRLYRARLRAGAVVFITINKYRLLNTLKRVLGGNLYRHQRAWRLVFYGRNAVQILESVNLKHREKISKRDVTLRMKGKRWSEAENEWLEIVDGIRNEIAEYKESARSEYIRLHGRRHPKDMQ